MKARTKLNHVGAVLLGGLCVLSAGTPASADLLEEPTFIAGRDGVLFMFGEISGAALDAFEDAVEDHPATTTLVPCIVPGSSDDNAMIEMSYLVRDMGLRTHLTSRSQVASGGTDLFLAGEMRTMVSGADIGVHSWSDGENDAADFPRTSPEHDLNRDYIVDMLGADAFYWFTIYAAPADDMHWMTAAEITTYGLLTAPVQTDDSAITCPDIGAERLIP